MVQARERKEAIEFVLHSTKEHDVKFIRLWFTDILGGLKGFAITAEELREALERGKPFDGSSIEGFARSDPDGGGRWDPAESDLIALPDPTTFTLLPWRPRQNAVAKMFCDVLTPDGEPFEGDSRQVLQRNLRRASDLGYTYYIGLEIEFFYFKDNESTQVLDHSGYFDQTSLDVGSELRRETVLTLEQMGLPVEYSHHEVAPSQHEIDLRYGDALTMADAVMTYRLAVKEVATSRGVYATFMPKPINGVNGSGMHVSQSLFHGEANAFFSKKDEYHLSDLAKHFVAGQLAHARETSVVTNQWVNSYKRLVPGFEAPVNLTWARRSRSDLVRIPDYRPGRGESTRVEYRAPDSAANPYLAFSVLLAAGLEGMEREMELPPPSDHAPDDQGGAGRPVESLPSNLMEAVDAAKESTLVRQALGDHVFDSFLRNKQNEWEEYRGRVHEYERRRYLPVL